MYLHVCGLHGQVWLESHHHFKKSTSKSRRKISINQLQEWKLLPAPRMFLYKFEVLFFCHILWQYEYMFAITYIWPSPNLTKPRSLFTLSHRGSDNSPLLIVFKWTLYELRCIMILTNQIAYFKCNPGNRSVGRFLSRVETMGKHGGHLVFPGGFHVVS